MREVETDKSMARFFDPKTGWLLCYREGIEEARRQNLTHAAGEMAELLMSLGDE